ncbi:MAG: hypothetical protein ACRCWB_02545 [Enterovibrio sp.]
MASMVLHSCLVVFAFALIFASPSYLMKKNDKNHAHCRLAFSSSVIRFELRIELSSFSAGDLSHYKKRGRCAADSLALFESAN